MKIYLLFIFFLSIPCAIQANGKANNESFAPSSFDSTDKDMINHRDRINGFAIRYPKSWSMVPTTHDKTKFKIVSENGKGNDDFSVVVVYDSAFDKITSEKLVEMALKKPEVLLAQLRSEFPDAKIIESGKTYLSNKVAYYVIFDANFRSFEFDVPMRFLQVSTITNSRAYYLTSRTDPKQFKAMRPIFTFIMGGFNFLKP